MTIAKRIFTIVGLILFFFCLLNYCWFSARISIWIPTVTLLYWFIRGEFGRPLSGAGYISHAIYQIINTIVLCINAVILVSAIRLIMQGQFYQRMIANIPGYWESHQYILGRPVEVFILAITALYPVSAIAFAGTAIVFIIKNEWHGALRRRSARSSPSRLIR
jgi:hypothetical protein